MPPIGTAQEQWHRERLSSRQCHRPLGRRIKKVVTNSGNLDKTEVYLFDGQKIIETRNGSGTMVQQFIHGTQYIDELVMVRVKDKGDLYIHQDANWNVIGTTDLGRHLVERNVYSPYGELTVDQKTGYGDRDGDGDVDSTDKGTVGVTCTGTVSAECRIMDLDFDGGYDSADATKFDALPQGLQRTPGKLESAVQLFAHQGLLFEPEIGSYQNRSRQYDPEKRRHMSRHTSADKSSYALAVLQHGFTPNLYLPQTIVTSQHNNSSMSISGEDGPPWQGDPCTLSKVGQILLWYPDNGDGWSRCWVDQWEYWQRDAHQFGVHEECYRCGTDPDHFIGQIVLKRYWCLHTTHSDSCMGGGVSMCRAEFDCTCYCGLDAACH